MGKKKLVDRSLNLYHDYMCGMKQSDIAKKYSISGPRVSVLIYESNMSDEFQSNYLFIMKNNKT